MRSWSKESVWSTEWLDDTGGKHTSLIVVPGLNHPGRVSQVIGDHISSDSNGLVVNIEKRGFIVVLDQYQYAPRSGRRNHEGTEVE